MEKEASIQEAVAPDVTGVESLAIKLPTVAITKMAKVAKVGQEETQDDMERATMDVTKVPEGIIKEVMATERRES